MTWGFVLMVLFRLAVLAVIVVVVIRLSTRRRMPKANPWGIHCVECSVRRPCAACQAQVDAERTWRPPS